MALTAAQALEALQVQGTDAYLKGLQSVSAPVADLIAREIPMTTETLSGPIAKMVGPMREWLGSRQVQAIEKTNHVLVAKLFELTVGCPRTAVDDDQTGTYMVSYESMGQQAAAWKDQQVVAKLALGETDLGYDGVAFFSDSHPEDYGNPDNANTYDNLIGTGSAAWYVMDISKALKPMVFGMRERPVLTHRFDPSDPHVFDNDEYLSGVRARGVADYGFPQTIVKCKNTLDATNFEACEYALRSRVNGAGENLGLNATLVLVPSIHATLAKKLFGRSDLGSDGVNVHQGVNWVVCQRLANS